MTSTTFEPLERILHRETNDGLGIRGIFIVDSDGIPVAHAGAPNTTEKADESCDGLKTTEIPLVVEQVKKLEIGKPRSLAMWYAERRVVYFFESGFGVLITATAETEVGRLLDMKPELIRIAAVLVSVVRKLRVSTHVGQGFSD